MKQINVSVQDETYRAAKGAAGHEGLGFARWVEKTIRAACRLGEVSVENGDQSGVRKLGLPSAEDRK